MKSEFTVSLMCMDYLHISEQIEILNQNADGYHIDIMDGHFCKNITLGPDFIKACAKLTTKPIDVHLMTTNPNDWIEACARAGASLISPHAETINADAFRTLNMIKAAGCRTGVTLNPATPLSYCRHYLSRIDVLTIMCVDVGYSGQSFIEEMLDKITEARRLREENGWHYKILIDGSCNEESFRKLHAAGAEAYVMGNTGLFRLDPDLRKACCKMKEIFTRETGEAV